MKLLKKTLFALVIALLGLTNPSLASTVVLDWSPLVTGATVTGPSWWNMYGGSNLGQHFAERVSFQTDTNIIGMDIYAANSSGAVGMPVVVTVYQDDGGTPGAILERFFVPITEIDSVGAPPYAVGGVPAWVAPAVVHRVHADIAGFLMEAGTAYWIGLAGDGYLGELTQAGYYGWADGDGLSAVFHGDTYAGMASDVGDLAFRLHANVVPEPGSGTLAAMALITMATVRRRRERCAALHVPQNVR